MHRIHKFRQNMALLKIHLFSAKKCATIIMQKRKEVYFMGWLQNNFEIDKWTEILIDNDKIESDNDGNYLINIAYRRVSTDKQAEEGYGLDVQRNDIIRHCEYAQLNNCILFTDDGVTGTTMDRPGLNHFIELVERFNQGRSKFKINSFIVPRIDRLSRSLLGTLQFIQDYIVESKDSKNSMVNTNTYDINFISIGEPFVSVDRKNPTSKLMLVLFAGLAEYDRDQIVLKMQRGREERIKSGKPMGGGNQPFGYKYNRETGNYDVVPEEKEKVQEIFRLYVEEKMPPAKIADLLGFKGERIVVQILKRRTSLGYLTFKGKEYAGNHEPLISEKIFYEAQEEMQRRSIVHTKSQYLLSGLLVCGDCGAKMRYQKWGKSVKIVCYSQQKTKKYLIKDPDCQNLKYYADDIEEAVIGELFRVAYLNNKSVKHTVSQYEVVENLKLNLRRKQDEIKRLYNVYAEKGNEQLLEVITEREKEIERLQQTIEDENKKSSITYRLERSRELLRDLENSWSGMTMEDKKSICNHIIDQIIISGASGKPSITVKFNLQEFLLDESTKA